MALPSQHEQHNRFEATAQRRHDLDDAARMKNQSDAGSAYVSPNAERANNALTIAQGRLKTSEKDANKKVEFGKPGAGLLNTALAFLIFSIKRSAQKAKKDKNEALANKLEHYAERLENLQEDANRVSYELKRDNLHLAEMNERYDELGALGTNRTPAQTQEMHHIAIDIQQTQERIKELEQATEKHQGEFQKIEKEIQAYIKDPAKAAKDRAAELKNGVAKPEQNARATAQPSMRPGGGMASA